MACSDNGITSNNEQKLPDKKLPDENLPDKNITENVLNLGCSHYSRNCKLISPCCKKKYVCRLCHDEKEDHPINRFNIKEIVCLSCGTEQPVSQYCVSLDCKIRFGKHFCRICNLFDNEDRKQYHCDGCGLCRVGGRENFFHCDRCQMCLPKSIATSHKCIEEISLRDCAVCLEDIHTSRIVSHMPPCGHLIHTTCFNDLLNAGLYACPICGKSMFQMDSVWQKLDEEIAETPMPNELTNVLCIVWCKDCLEEAPAPFHTLGLKCSKCGSYNTSRGGGALFTNQELD